MKAALPNSACTKNDAENNGWRGEEEEEPSDIACFKVRMVLFARYIMTVTLFFHHERCNKQQAVVEEYFMELRSNTRKTIDAILCASHAVK